MISVGVTGIATFGRLVASPLHGIAPLTVEFSLPATPDGARIDLDADGDGNVDYTGFTLDRAAFVYARPGLYVATATVTDASGTRTMAQTVVQVLDQVTLDGLLQAKWAGMKAALRGADIAAAVEFIVDRRRADYEAAFRLLAGRLTAIDAILADVSLVTVRNAAAVYEMLRVDDGLLKSFQIRFALESDGVWRLEGL
jgi:hypothetical protein